MAGFGVAGLGAAGRAVAGADVAGADVATVAAGVVAVAGDAAVAGPVPGPQAARDTARTAAPAPARTGPAFRGCLIAHLP